MKTFEQIVKPYLPKEPADCPFCVEGIIGTIHYKADPNYSDPDHWYCECDCGMKAFGLTKRESIRKWNSYLLNDLSFLLGVLEEMDCFYELMPGFLKITVDNRGKKIVVKIVHLSNKIPLEAVKKAIEKIGNEQV